MNRQYKYINVKIAKAAHLENCVQNQNMEEWCKEMKTGLHKKQK